MAAPSHHPQPGWLLDEVASAGKENLDADHVLRYDAKEDANVEAELLLLRELGLHHESVVVDIGAGTGQLALAVAPQCARVVAVDVSPVMLTTLKDKVAASNLSNVHVVQAGFLTYEHHGGPADFVYSRYALHHLPDFWKVVALERIRRILKPGGVFRLWDVVYSFDPDEAEERIEAWCAAGGTDVEEGWVRTEFEDHIRDEHSTFTWLLEAMIVRTGLQIRSVSYSEDGFFAKYALEAT